MALLPPRGINIPRGADPRRDSASEWTSLCSNRPNERTGSHTAASFLLFPAKLCRANFCGGPGLGWKRAGKIPSDLLVILIWYWLSTGRRHEFLTLLSGEDTAGLIGRISGDFLTSPDGFVFSHKANFDAIDQEADQEPQDGYRKIVKT